MNETIMTTNDLQVLADLLKTVDARKDASPDESYTAYLLSKGVEKCAKKFGEEAIEVALAAMTGNKPHIASEAADTIYHLMVLLAVCDVPFAQVTAQLKGRTGQSGHAEKASRSSDLE